MSTTLLPVGFALFCWWFGTGIVFLLERAMRQRRQRAIAGIGVMGALSLLGIVESCQVAHDSGAYLAFASSIGLWGALELSFLTGLITGRRVPSCDRDCRGWRHFGHAVQALLYHELALAFFALAVVAICWNQPNPTAACTYGLLWVMRESAKLNLFLGVRNTAVELLPERLAHLARYFGKNRINLLLPLSVVAASIGDILLVRHALAESATNQDRVAGLLLATLLALAIVEHLVLVLPVRADALWTWATRRSNAKAGPPLGGASHLASFEPDSAGSVVGAARATGMVPIGPAEAAHPPPMPPGAPA